MTSLGDLWEDLHPDPFKEVADLFDILIKHGRLTSHTGNRKSTFLFRLAEDLCMVTLVVLLLIFSLYFSIKLPILAFKELILKSKSKMKID